jgi:hypothetical protein
MNVLVNVGYEFIIVSCSADYSLAMSPLGGFTPQMKLVFDVDVFYSVVTHGLEYHCVWNVYRLQLCIEFYLK